MSDLPLIISVDDHVVEPPDLWQSRLASRWRPQGPRMERMRGYVRARRAVARVSPTGHWRLGRLLGVRGSGPAHHRRIRSRQLSPHEAKLGAVVWDEIRPGCYDQAARLADMDENGLEAALCFPTLPRFCGQTFLEGSDPALALACVQAYNDWMMDGACAGPGFGRLIPLTLIPLWDPVQATAECADCAAKGSHAVAFSESQAALGLPSVHTDHWDPLWQACEETETVVNMHIGSSSTFPTTGPDAPNLVIISLTSEGSVHAFVDWIASGILVRFPTLRIALSEGQVGWMPFTMERLDGAWEHVRRLGGVNTIPEPPSSYVKDRVFGCIFDDSVGLRRPRCHRDGADHVRDRLSPHGLNLSLLPANG